MANYYTEFSEQIDLKTEEEVEWAKKEIDKMVIAWDADEELDMRCGYVLNEDPGWAWFYSEDNGNIEFFIEFAQSYLNKFAKDSLVSISYANTASSPRIGAFAGGAVVVSASKIYHYHTSAWLSETIRKIEKKRKSDVISRRARERDLDETRHDPAS